MPSADVDTLISIAKVGGIILTCVLGIVGTLYPFQSISGRLSRWGTATIVGIVCSSGLALLGAYAETRRNEAEAIEQRNRAEKVLSEIHRSMNLITTLNLTYLATVPRNSLSDAYYSRIERRIAEIRETSSDSRNLSPNAMREVGVTPVYTNDTLSWLGISKQSDLYPAEDDGVMSALLKFYCPDIYIRRVPLPDPSQFRPGTGDFSARCIGSGQSSLTYDLESRMLSITGRVNIDKNRWESNGRIVSLNDLEGAQLILVPPGFVDVISENRSHENLIDTKLFSQWDLTYITVELVPGRKIALSSKELTKSSYQYGYPIYSATLPK